NHSKVGVDEFSLDLLSSHLALYGLALDAAQVRIADPRLTLDLLQVGAAVALVLAIFLLQIIAASRVDLLLVALDLPVERAHGVDRLVHTVHQAFAFRVGELDGADGE